MEEPKGSDQAAAWGRALFLARGDGANNLIGLASLRLPRCTDCSGTASGKERPSTDLLWRLPPPPHSGWGDAAVIHLQAICGRLNNIFQWRQHLASTQLYKLHTILPCLLPRSVTRSKKSCWAQGSAPYPLEAARPLCRVLPIRGNGAEHPTMVSSLPNLSWGVTACHGKRREGEVHLCPARSKVPFHNPKPSPL